MSTADPLHLRIWGLILIHLKDKVTAQRMQQCIQSQPANPLEPWPHINTLILTRAGENQSVYSTCHPSFGKTCLFAPSSVQRLNKHSLAYATYYCFPGFVSTNHPHFRPQMWAGCKEFLRLIAGDVVWEGGPGNKAHLPPSPPFVLWGHHRSHLSAQTS